MIKYISDYNSVTLYWELPDTYIKDDLFVIKKGNEKIAETKNCHITIDGLKERNEYEFSLFLITKNREEKISSVTCKTTNKKAIIDITKPPYNAVGDGKTLNTKVIQKAIDNCKENECVYIPKGDFLTGALFLHSDMEVYIEKDGIIHGTENVSDYEPKIKSRFEGIELDAYASLINIGKINENRTINCKNIKIKGEGTIMCEGEKLKTNVIEKEMVLMKDYMDSLGDKIKECECEDTIPGRVRPRLINISCAENIIISGIDIKNGASWNVHMIYSQDIVTYNCRFYSEGIRNGDGWDPDSSSNCTIFGCVFYTGDDSVAIKSGKNPEGNIINIPCSHIRVFDLISYCGHGITIGSEISGGIEDVKIWNCNTIKSLHGVEIKGTRKRGGYVKNIDIRNSQFCRILIHSVGYNDDGEPAKNPPVFANINFENIELYNSVKNPEDNYKTIEVIGFDEDEYLARDITLKNISIDSRNEDNEILLKFCDNICMKNLKSLNKGE